MKRNRLQLLLQHDISLIAYHLPLDAHPELGNNAQLARQLGIEITGGLQPGANPIGNIGRLREAMAPEAFAAKIGQRLGRTAAIDQRRQSCRFKHWRGVPAPRRTISSRRRRWGSMRF